MKWKQRIRIRRRLWCFIGGSSSVSRLASCLILILLEPRFYGNHRSFVRLQARVVVRLFPLPTASYHRSLVPLSPASGTSCDD